MKIKLFHLLPLWMLLSGLAWPDEIFPVALPECSAKLERRTAEAGVLMVRSDCPLSLPSLAQLLDKGLSGLFPDRKLPIHGIYLGRLMNYPEWSQDLAKVAAKSPAWNSKRGRPSQAGESDNRRVRALLNGASYPPMLKPVFAKYGLKPCIADVEKVLVFKTKDIFPNKTERPAGISTEARLPADAQIWLTLQPSASDCGE